MSLRTLSCFLAALLLPCPSPAQRPDSIGDGGPAVGALLDAPHGVAVDAGGNIYVAEQRGHRIRRIDARTGIITTFAGTGEIGSTGDGGPATEARINYPEIATAPNGDLLIGEIDGYRIRRVDARSGVIRTIAGTGRSGFSGDGGPATAAEITRPFAIEVDRDGNIYFADTESHRIRRIDANSGIITTVAGNGTWDYAGDGGPAVAAALARPHVLLLEPDGDLIIGDSFNQRIRRVDAVTGIITTIAGSGAFGSAGDRGPALAASFAYFADLALDDRGDLLISGVADHRIRRLDIRTGIIHPFAGTGRWDSGGDGGPATEASFHPPGALAWDRSGDLLVVDKFGGRLRRIDSRTGLVATVAGSRPTPDWPGAFHNHYDRAQLERELHAPFALQVPNAAAARVRSGLAWTESANPRKRVDLYLPPDPAGVPPVVVLVHTATRSDLDIPPTQWQSHIGRARAFAASGMAVVLYNHEMKYYPMRPVAPAAELQTVLEWIEREGRSLGVDGSRVCVAALGDGAPLVSVLLATPRASLRCIALIHPVLDIREPRFLADEQPLAVQADYSPLIQFSRNGQNAPPILLIAATRDNPENVADAQRFERLARVIGARVELLTHSSASAGFDVAAPGPETEQLLRRWIEFVRQELQR